MPDIHSIVIVGAGAMGAAYAAMFSDAGGFQVAFGAREPRYGRLDGAVTTVNDRPYRIPVIHPDRAAEPADLVLVALKAHHLKTAASDIAAYCGPETAVLSVMNGLESEEHIGAACGMDKLVDAVVLGIDAVFEDGRYRYSRPGTVYFGPIPGRSDGPDIRRIARAFDRASIPYDVPEDIRRTMWWKFMINVGVNQSSAVLGAPYAVFQTSEDARSLMNALMDEVIRLAEKEGVSLTEKDRQEWNRVLMGLSPDGKTSMLQDVEAGRPTEAEIFAGTVMRLGALHGVPTPVNETVYRILRIREGRI